MQTLANKVAVITGGNSGIGYATARRFIEHGAKVIITGRKRASVDEAAKALGAFGIVSDQAKMADIQELAAAVKALEGTVDILFLNAGLATFGPAASFSEAQYDALMDTNVKGVFFTIQHFIPLLKDGASIIFNASVNAVLGAPDSSIYSASKAALLALNRVLSKELASRKIRVNAISPGPIATPLYEKLGLTDEQTNGFSEALNKKILLHRFGTPDEIADAVRFLASDEASFITGTELTIDGGLTVNTVVD